METAEKFKEINKTSKDIGKKVSDYRNNAFSKAPLLFVLLSSFGLVATFYGFEKVIDQIPFFNNHPTMILFTGIILLITTGSLFKKLN